MRICFLTTTPGSFIIPASGDKGSAWGPFGFVGIINVRND